MSPEPGTPEVERNLMEKRQFTMLTKLLKEKNFVKAMELLKKHLELAELMDPGNDESWAPYADHIASKISEVEAENEVIKFWKELLDFFTNELEAKWGHLHKGHIFFRLGVSYLDIDLNNSKGYLERALEEDKLRWPDNYKHKSTYTMLSIVDKLSPEFENNSEKKSFFQALKMAFDLSIVGGGYDPQITLKHLRDLTAKLDQEFICARYKELINDCRNSPFLTIFNCGVVLEFVLLNKAYEEGMNKIREKELKDCTLGDLYHFAKNNNWFPNDKIKNSCQLVYNFRNLIHPANYLSKWKYELTLHTGRIVMNVLEKMINDWGNRLYI